MNNFLLSIDFILSETAFDLDAKIDIKFINDEENMRGKFFRGNYARVIQKIVTDYVKERLFYRKVPSLEPDLKMHAKMLIEAIEHAMEPQITEVSRMSILDIKKLMLAEKLKQ